MKKSPLPFLRTFLLLTLCVGLLGNAKILLLQNDKLVHHARLASANTKTVSHRPTTKPLAQVIIKDSEKPLAVKEPLAVNKSLVVNKPSADKQPLASNKLLANNQTPTKHTQEPTAGLTSPISDETLIKPSAELSIDTAKQSLSDLIENDSIDSTIKSLEKVVKEFSNESRNRPIVAATENIELPHLQNNFTHQKDYAYQTDYVFQNKLARQAEKRLHSNVRYDGRYMKIGYPMGDVPSDMGVCTDVVIRAFRGLGIDLQQRVHEDMKYNFRRYPNNWQLSRPDSNIDHRRVPNLMTYFKRANMSVNISSNPLNYDAGDIVAWDMGNGLTHIGIVSTQLSAQSGNPLIVHNIGVGPEMTDILFDFKIIGHYKSGKYRNVTLASLN